MSRTLLMYNTVEMTDLPFLIICLVGNMMREVHQEEIMSCVCDYNECINKMKINNFLWEALLGAFQIQMH